MNENEQVIYSLALSVMSVATGMEDSSLFEPRCAEMYDYFWSHLDDINREDGVCFHVGSAFYFYARSLKNQDSKKYRFSTLVSFLNLSQALAAQNMQSSIAAHRLYLLISSDDSFFDVTLMSMMFNIRELLDEDPNDIFENIQKLKSYINYFLFQYTIGTGAVSFLTKKKKKEIKGYSEIATNEIQRCSADTFRENVIKGNKVMTALRFAFNNKIGIIRFLGEI